MQQWREARAARDAARDALTVAEVNVGVRQRISLGLRALLAVLAVLAVAGAGVAAWAAFGRGPSYSDQQLVDAATERVEVLLATDAQNPDRAQQILAGATGEFHDAFAQSADAYTSFLQRTGTVGAAQIDGSALVGREGDRGVVLVAASVQGQRGKPGADPAVTRDRETLPIRLRVMVEPESDVLKLSGVVFLP